MGRANNCNEVACQFCKKRKKKKKKTNQVMREDYARRRTTLDCQSGVVKNSKGLLEVRVRPWVYTVQLPVLSQCFC